MVQLRIILLAGLSGPLLAFAAPPELPPASTQQPLAPPGSSAPAMSPLPIEPPPPATTPLLPSDPAGPVRPRSGADSSVAAPAGTLVPRSFRSLDSDADGSLTREEAGADPILRENFADFDSNGDGRLSRDEFASYQPGPGDAAGD
ncbi:EF-hand domain-containing protein [Xanthomonas sp. 4461]|uniref:EF-hand domain-containing protein n=1 Tax=Xanthomonas sp. 4461 TaxID=3035313 RepID=UPI002167594D|nr:EF-hand domain-containing protein [Xanthomonas sp. 4461]